MTKPHGSKKGKEPGKYGKHFHSVCFDFTLHFREWTKWSGLIVITLHAGLEAQRGNPVPFASELLLDNDWQPPYILLSDHLLIRVFFSTHFHMRCLHYFYFYICFLRFMLEVLFFYYPKVHCTMHVTFSLSLWIVPDSFTLFK